MFSTKKLSEFFLIFSLLVIGWMKCGISNGDKEFLFLKVLEGKSSIVDSVLEQSERYKVQILYTQIDRDSANNPSFQAFAYRVNTDKYFYPASSVKFPTAVLALEKLNRLNIVGLDRNTPLKIDSAYSGQSAVTHDSTAPDYLPTIGNYIKKIFLVSDNDAYNRLYEFLGQQYIYETLKEKDYHHIHLIRRLERVLSPEQNRATNPFIFYVGDRNIYEQPLVINNNDFRVKMNEIRQGSGYYKNTEFIAKPMDFSYSNYFAISTQQEIMKAVIFPDAVVSKKRFDLTIEDYQFLYRYMSMLPRESEFEMYRDTTQYFDGYVKLFMFGDSKEKIPSHIRIFNKSGQAYGYLSDNAYIIDLKNKIEFFLSAVLQVNENQIYNDDIYEYEEIGFPFLADLATIIYQYEINRKRKKIPNLSRFEIY